MNANEVIATLAARRLGRDVHPNDHVNASQSSNDVFPSAIHLAATRGVVLDLVPALRHLEASLTRKADEFADVVKSVQQAGEGLASVAPILELAAAKGVDMPIVKQVSEVLAGTLNPRDIAPHLTTDSDEPQGERTIDGRKNTGGSAFWRPFKRALNQLRDGGRSSSRD
jgi:hypothetical protein